MHCIVQGVYVVISPSIEEGKEENLYKNKNRIYEDVWIIFFHELSSLSDR
jgi:hypothetical protein